MRALTFFIFLLITSGLLFAPVIQPAQQIELAPETVNDVIIVIRSTSVQLETDIASIVLINVSLINDDGSTQSIETNKQLVGSTIVSLPETGAYEFSLFSEDFGMVEIDQDGITTFQLIYYTILTIVFLYILNKRYEIIS